MINIHDSGLMGYPALSHHNSFLFILKTMNFGTLNLNFRTLHSCMLAKFKARQGDGDNTRTLTCDSVTEVVGRFLIMSNKSPSMHSTAGVSSSSASPPAAEEAPSGTQTYPSPPVPPGHDSFQSFSRGGEQHPQAGP